MSCGHNQGTTSKKKAQDQLLPSANSAKYNFIFFQSFHFSHLWALNPNTAIFRRLVLQRVKGILACVLCIQSIKAEKTPVGNFLKQQAYTQKN